MKKLLLSALSILAISGIYAVEAEHTLTPEYMAMDPNRHWTYTPSEEILKSRQEFRDAGFGVFLHWGIYSMFAQGEWYLNYDINAEEYAKAARGFYPAHFDAKEWVSAIKDAGAKYICITTRHHDGFSMFDSELTDYDIVDATPFKRDIIKEIADECHRQGIKLHFYYSHIDWTRPDYPSGRTGLKTGRDTTLRDWPSYYKFMNGQLTELLTKYGDVGAIWFDGWWDHQEDSIPYNWELPEQYQMIHKLQPSCLIGNNHHQFPFPGEDIQIFERDLPGQDTSGLSGQGISDLPLETCNTMNGMWGYQVSDQNYKPTRELIQYLVKAAGMGANLLLNIGPQPSGELPAAALERLKEIGEWMREYGETFYATQAGDFPEQSWGTSTRKGDKLYVHVMTPESTDIFLPTKAKVKSATDFKTGEKIDYTVHKEKDGGGVTLHLPQLPDVADYVITVETK